MVPAGMAQGSDDQAISGKTGEIKMTEIILKTRTLPEPLLRMIHTENVKARELQGEIRLTPVNETDSDCPFFGMFADGKISVDKFLAEKHAEKELEL